MPTIAFIGRVFPPGKKLSLPPFPSLTATGPDGERLYEIVFTLEKSVIKARCIGERIITEMFMECYLQSLEVAHMVVDMAAFHEGLAVHAVWEQFVDTEGVVHDIVLEDPALRGICTAYDIGVSLAPAYHVLLQEGPLRLAMSDLIRGISHPKETAINCGRVVEALRGMVADKGASQKEAWQQFRDRLNVDRSYLQPITDASVAPRHGDRVPIDPLTNQDLTVRAWKIMNRYLEYRVGGSVPLSPPKFDLLLS